MENELRFRNQIETGLRRGLARGEFVPFYEQQIDLETGQLVGFEMLARWQSPQLGLVSPEIFIPIAEENRPDHRTVRTADGSGLCRCPRMGRQPDPVDQHLAGAIARSVVCPAPAEKKLVAANLPPQRLEIEITESCLHENIGLVRSMITSLRNQGVQVSLDDFGTGYSSIEQLRNLPFDRLKIDRSFISELRQPEGRSRIVDAIVSLGRGLDLPLTAEGVEDEEILTALKSMGRLKAQGYFYGKPENAEAVRERLRVVGKLAVVRDRPAAAVPLDTPAAQPLYRIARP